MTARGPAGWRSSSGMKRNCDWSMTELWGGKLEEDASRWSCPPPGEPIVVHAPAQLPSSLQLAPHWSPKSDPKSRSSQSRPTSRPSFPPRPISRRARCNTLTFGAPRPLQPHQPMSRRSRRIDATTPTNLAARDTTPLPRTSFSLPTASSSVSAAALRLVVVLDHLAGEVRLGVLALPDRSKP